MSENQTPPAITPPVPKKRGRKKGSVATVPAGVWLAAERDWVQGKFPSADLLAAHHGIDSSQFRKKMSEKGLKNGQAIAEYNRTIERELQEKAERQAKILAERIEETREEHYRWASGIAKLTFAEVAKARQENIPFGNVRPNLQALESAMKVLKMAREERFAILGLDGDNDADDDDGLPELAVAELSQEQITQLQERGTPVEEEDEIEVVSLDEEGSPQSAEDDTDALDDESA